MEINCLCCSTPFEVSELSSKKYCSSECRKKYGRLNGAYIGISPGSVGAMAELCISSDLLSRGYNVFRSVSQNSVCDLIALKNNKSTTIEVKSGHYNRRGNMIYPHPTERQLFDVLAIYIHETKEVVYFPSIDPICKNPYLE